MLKPVFEEKTQGTAESRGLQLKFGNIAGCMVTDGHIRHSAKTRLLRDGVVVFGVLDRLTALERRMTSPALQATSAA